MNKVSFICDQNGKKTHAVVPIDVYRSLISLREMLKPQALPSGEEIYTLAVKNLAATGYPTGDRTHPYFLVIKGSQASLSTANSLPKHIKLSREQLIADGKLSKDNKHDCLVFTENMQFKSPSFAAAIIAGNIRNGMDVWISREGFTLKQSGYGIKNLRSYR